jgi:hypothetical protein
MSTLFSPLHLLSVALAGWMNRHQQAVIDYLVVENQLLAEQPGIYRVCGHSPQHIEAPWD